MSDSRRARSLGRNIDWACRGARVAGAYMAFPDHDPHHVRERLVSGDVSWRSLAVYLGKTVQDNLDSVNVASRAAVESPVRRIAGGAAVLGTQNPPRK